MATREIIELPDKHTGDINEIRDKKIALAKDATAQSDLPQQLEYLIKNGQTGEFMNVLDSYINEKIRSALGSLIASLDKGAAGTTKAIACIDTNNDLGIINPANLASVLGVQSVGTTFTVKSLHAILFVTSSWAGSFAIFVLRSSAGKDGKYKHEVYSIDEVGQRSWCSISNNGATFTINTSVNGAWLLDK